MKRFITSILTVSLFFITLGAMIDSVGAKFKSDEKALEIIRAARTAIGGESALRGVNSLVITGKTTHSMKVNGVERSESGETEIALQLPDKMMKSIKIGNHTGDAANMHNVVKEVIVTDKDGGEMAGPGKTATFSSKDGKEFTIKLKGDENGEFITEDGKKVVVRSVEKSSTTATGDGEAKVFIRKQGDGSELKSEGGKNVVFERKAMPGHDGGFKQNELLRTTLGLLLTAPEGMDVSYTFVGEGDVDGTSVNIINASFAGANYKLFIGKSNSLPVAISFTGHAMPAIMHFEKEVPATKDAKHDVMVFKRHDEMAGKSAEMTIKFADFRSTGGVQLPYKWTTVSGGQTVETFDVTSYDVNPANIADRFKDQKTMVRMKHPDSK